jgi:uncharacterized membrane protein
MRDSRPRLDIPWTPADRALELLALAALVGFAGVAAAFAGGLPERIPIHFGFGGNPDGWAGPASRWALPALALVLYATLTWVSRVPHAYNYPWAITPANAERQYRLARRLVLALKALVCWQFGAIYLQSLEVTTGARPGLSPWLTFSFLIAPLGLVVAYLVAATRGGPAS